MSDRERLGRPGPARRKASKTGVPAGLLDLQRAIGNRAVSNLVDSMQQEREIQSNAGAPVSVPLSAESIVIQPIFDSLRNLRSSTRRKGRNADPRGRTRRAAEPVRSDDTLVEYKDVRPPADYEGRRLWSGKRQDIPFYPTVREDILAGACAGIDGSGNSVYQCKMCSRIFPRHSMEIDHVEGIIAYVIGNTEEQEEEICLDKKEQIFRKLRFVYRDDAKAAANDASDLRVLCSDCNKRRAVDSESRHMDTEGPKWVGEPYRSVDAGAGPSS